MSNTAMQDKVQGMIDELERRKGAEHAANVFEHAMAMAMPKYKSGSGKEVLFGLVAAEMEKAMK